MILTAGIELADGKSNLDEPTVVDPLGTFAPAPPDATGVDTPVVVSAGGATDSGTDAAARQQHMGYQAVTIGFETPPQPLENGLITRIARGQRGACRQQREP